MLGIASSASLLDQSSTAGRGGVHFLTTIVTSICGNPENKLISPLEICVTRALSCDADVCVAHRTGSAMT